MPEQEFFPATNGRFTGVLGLVVAAGIVIASVRGVGDSLSVPVLACGVLLAVLTYVAVLRPRVGLEGDDLVLRQMLSTVRIPLAAIDEVDVRHTTVVRAAGRRFDSPALSRPRRRRRAERWRGPAGLPGGMDLPEVPEGTREPTPAELYEARIREAVAAARQGAVDRDASRESAAQVRTEWSRPWLALTVLALLGAALAFTL